MRIQTSKKDSTPTYPMRIPHSPMQAPSSFRSLYLSSKQGEAKKGQADNSTCERNNPLRKQPSTGGQVEMPLRANVSSAYSGNSKKSMRIPSSFQSVYLSSNHGNEMIEFPADATICTGKAYNRKQPFKDSKLNLPIRTNSSSDIDYFFERDKESNDSATDSETSSDSFVPLRLSLHFSMLQEKESRISDSQDHSSGNYITSPKDYLDALLKSRGYPTRTKKATETGYYTEPTPLQKMSYHPRLIDLARDGQNNKLRSIMTSGISLNPCNSHGESLLHIVCRRGKHDTFQVLLDCGSTVQTCDNYGRTLFHEACTRVPPCFEMIEQIASKDLHLFHLVDNRGFTPLSYVNKEYWNKWICFIESKKDTWWPLIYTTGSDRRERLRIPASSELLDIAPKTRSIPDPDNALDLKLAEMVLKGVISPKEAILLNQDDNSSDNDDDEYHNDDFSESCPSLVDFTCRSESLYTESTFGEDEYLDYHKR